MLDVTNKTCECGNPAEWFNTGSFEVVCDECKTEKACKNCPLENCLPCHLKLVRDADGLHRLKKVE